MKRVKHRSQAIELVHLKKIAKKVKMISSSRGTPEEVRVIFKKLSNNLEKWLNDSNTGNYLENTEKLIAVFIKIKIFLDLLGN